ncbi:acyltransferase family protein [Mycobacterium sp. ITM-2016-00317]|uniref:acyltransferase family protein n=1 Tax=Mycobacterium sp. ITM-2016-00317 TaxID=2099694 RepID=UPI0037CAA52F
MRAVAVLVVFADHLFGWPSGGFVGVDVFFVLSGFFITGLLLKERSRTGELSFKNFYVRRVKRILPSALLVLVVTVIGAHLLLTATRAKSTLLDALWAAVFGANINFEMQGTDYFQQDQPPSPIQHYWSLSIEEQFYFVWPWVLLALFAITRKASRRGHGWTRHWALFGSMFLIVAASFTWAMLLSSTDPNAAYFSTFTRIWELGVGALMAIAGPWLTRIPDQARPVLAYAGLAGVAASLFLIDSTVQFPAPWAALPVLSTALVIAAFHGGQVRHVPMLTNRVAEWFGDTSYTLYLWHWPVIVLLVAVIPEGPLFYALAIILALGLTAITYHFYENPIRRSDWLLDPPMKTQRWQRPRLSLTAWSFIGFALCAIVIVSIVGIRFSDMRAVAEQADEEFVIEVPPPLAPAPVNASRVVTPPVASLPGKDPCFGAPAMTNAECALRNPDVELTPSVDKFATDGGSPTCWTPKDQPLNSCTYGYDGPDATRIALVGDSHGARVLVAIAPYLEPYKWQLTTYLGWGCAWQEPAQAPCATAMDDINRALLEQRYDLVVTTASRNGGDPAHYVRAWRPVAAGGARIAVLADNPAVSEESINCLTRVSFGADTTGECATPRSEALERRDPLEFAAERTPAATLIDLTAYYCTEDRCPSVIGDVIVYSDVGGHLTATYIRTLAPAIVEGIRQALSAPR